MSYTTLDTAWMIVNPLEGNVLHTTPGTNAAEAWFHIKRDTGLHRVDWEDKGYKAMKVEICLPDEVGKKKST